MRRIALLFSVLCLLVGCVRTIGQIPSDPSQGSLRQIRLRRRQLPVPRSPKSFRMMRFRTVQSHPAAASRQMLKSIRMPRLPWRWKTPAFRKKTLIT